MDSKPTVKKMNSNSSFASGTTFNSTHSNGSYRKTTSKSTLHSPPSRRSSDPKAEIKREKPDFTPIPTLLPGFKLDSRITNSGFFKTSELVLLGDVAVKLKMLPKAGRSRITAVKSYNPVTVVLGTNYDYYDANLGHRIRWAATNEVWGPGWHPLKFIKSFETLIYCHRNARIAKVTQAQMTWIRGHNYPTLTASTRDFPWSEEGLTKEIFAKLIAVR